MLFKCPKCSYSIEANPAATVQSVACPSCSTTVAIPPVGPVPGDVVFCSKCGAQNARSLRRCSRCSEVLQVQDYGPMGAIIPYKNGPALASYYLGIFSIVPCVGLLLGIAAVILGVIGLRRAKDHPEARGKAHAWTGIITGGIFGLFNLAIVVLMAIGMVGAAAASGRA